ncbi:MAG: DHH family phosphoesterase [Candidatus Parvarchaeota archaeon]|nr:DHH family phosphoesterase [Candidatus Jingweiarchaeum tengchongense]MCW1297687.1 DHH family phosphoesterase [Candidatus Jingweiarchaeum tengchongense]MCW1299698.1 DHH family phosphoesterase [Candidatus Jingweiarchaeum tengchongense]MCW1304334.1 DHH family phosphoesterase [Candidatus Jingweiarchaeum tengchongense]MCW1305683.1 DHH family phosphoesterase [Candidatus Jingweiarchaeum tengchongense]
MSISDFKLRINEIAREVNKYLENVETVRVISHYDTDGICAASIICKMLLRKNKKFHISLIKQLEKEKIAELEKETYSFFIFTDLGAGQIENLINLSKSSKILILDHHQLKDSINNENIIHINPHLFNIDGSEISGAGVSYLFTKEIDEKNSDLVHLAIIGAIGDRQEKDGKFFGINEMLLSEAVNSNIMEVKKGLRIFGRVSRPIHIVLQYSTDPFIPGVSGNESGAVRFLSDIGIKIKDESGRWRRMCDLSEEEERKLVTAVIMRRLDTSEKPEDVLGNVYTIKGASDILSDAHEFSSLLNACGRMNSASIGVMLCIGSNGNLIENVREIMQQYKIKILNALNWVLENLNNKERIITTDKCFYIIGKGDIDDNIIGTVCSIILESGTITTKRIIVGFANRENKVKVSIRSKDEYVNIGKICGQIAKKLNFEGGGHKHAGGARINLNSEKEFINEFEKYLNEDLQK